MPSGSFDCARRRCAPGFAQDDEVLAETGEEGFILIAAIVMIFMVLLVLSIAAPRVAKEIQRDREVESAHRAQQYVRAIRIYYNKFHRYPSSIEQMEKTNNQRFLRQKYDDPLTGKPDWRLIHVGENQTQVKGFFGDDLPGLPTGLGSAAGLASSNSGTPAGASTSTFGSSPTPGGAGGVGGGIGGGLSSNGATPTNPTTGAGTSGTAGTGTNSNGIQSQNATDATGTGAPIIGVGSAKSGEAMVVVNEQTTYETWEFLYDPRIEQLYAKSTLLGGISSGPGTSGSGLGTGTSNGFGTPIGTPIGGTPTTPTNGTGTPPSVGAPVPQ